MARLLIRVCTFIMAWRVFADEPVVVAANRDERLDRPSSPPAVFAENPRIVAPRDDEAGGTWLGYNEYGVLAGVTNRWTTNGLAGERSRGLLVGDALQHESATAAADAVETSTREYEYDGFNLVLADASDAILLEWDGALARTVFDPGLHIVVNVGYDDTFDIPDSDDERRETAARRQARRTTRALRDLQPGDAESVDEWLDRATAALKDPDYGFLVRGEGFGTRSASLVRLADDAAADTGSTIYWYADGPPDVNDFERVSP